ncbi:recombinase family protein (plasmid) [Streptomyces sp. NBC_01136]|uniref:recombinase family protein n=1 Tax=unclassified Streptomyces TaxID=2593676 RepID=UPI002F907313|nr:recombinase family protein [Streptomyces sp. NBC_01136]
MRRPRPHEPTITPGEPAALYCRISQADDDDQTGVDRQERICREIAERRGLTIDPAHVFVDNSRSAWSRGRKRPGWDQLLERAQRREFRHVIAYHPDRLMRQPRDLEELLQVSDEHQIMLHGEANRRNLSDPDDRFILRIEVAHDCRSSDDTSRQLKSALKERAETGLPHSGKRRFGYEADGMTVREDEAEIVREVFDRYLKGQSPSAIALILHKRGIKTVYGKEWTQGTVRALLDSRHVAGIRMHQGEEVGQGKWPAIIDQGMWEETRARREYRSAVHETNLELRRFYLLRAAPAQLRHPAALHHNLRRLSGRRQAVDHRLLALVTARPRPQHHYPAPAPEHPQLPRYQQLYPPKAESSTRGCPMGGPSRRRLQVPSRSPRRRTTNRRLIP